MKKVGLKDMSIKRIILAFFLLALLISIGSIGHIILSSWSRSAKETTRNIAEDISDTIYDQLSDIIDVPNHINDVNYKVIANNILDLSNVEQRDRFFAGVLSSHDEEIYSFSFGTINGEYYGARRSDNGGLEIMRNDATTGGESWYYTVNEDFTAGELASKAGKFDPRKRSWYVTAVAKGKPTYSDVYMHFVMEDLTLSASRPVYDSEGKLVGVIGTHMLLSDLSEHLSESMKKYDGKAIIIEKRTLNLIANSMGIENFKILPDGDIERINLESVNNKEFIEAFTSYSNKSNPGFFFEETGGEFYVNIREIHREGLEWVVISALPKNLLYTPLMESIRATIIIAVVAAAVYFFLFDLLTIRLLKPMNSLLQVSDELTKGELTKRVEIKRNDEIGKISASFNNMADSMQYLINNLEAAVQERTEELYSINETLQENREQLRLILDTAAEAIYGIDLNGNCTFCNISCIKMLGYEKPGDLLGNNMHYQIHHSNKDGSPLPISECRIMKTMKDKKGIHTDDEVFWRKDGTCFEIEYNAYPQIKNGEAIGAVISFNDISERRRKEEEIQYINCHDILTGLHNRRCFEENRGKVDIPENLPLSVIFADLNGLKMTNDIFGHVAGDELIKKSAEILKQSCRSKDLIARIGGDGVVVPLPKTRKEKAMKGFGRIKGGLIDARGGAIKGSISLCCDPKTKMSQSFGGKMSNAENEMYKYKTLNRKQVNKNLIDTIVDTLHTRSVREKQHSIAVRDICGAVGELLHLPETQITTLKTTGYLHDIGKIVLDKDILVKNKLTHEEYIIMQQHSAVGYRILNLFDETLDIAEYVYSHHEKWNGTGYPRGLKGEEIPLLSRIVSIVETYDRIIHTGDLPFEDKKKRAISEIRKGAGQDFDPHIAPLFADMMEKS